MAGTFTNGILLLSHWTNKYTLYKCLKESSKIIEKNLYIDLIDIHQSGKIGKEFYYSLMKNVYNRPASLCKETDIHVLLEKADSYDFHIHPSVSEEVNACILQNSFRDMNIESSIKSRYNNLNLRLHYINIEESEGKENLKPILPSKKYSGVVIGGTFDRIHDGHKLLISTALLLAENKITVGVADGDLLKNKILKELIEPIETRIKNVKMLIEKYKPGIQHKVVSITDPCGPSGTDSDLDLLVVSEETKGGGLIVNAKREENNLHTLDVFQIDLVGEEATDLSQDLNAEGKISSSASRVRTLGTLIKEPNFPKQPGRSYIIGMTGGIASGKSAVVKRLEKLGAVTINCDKLGHETYLPGRTAYNKIVENFGKEVLTEDGFIDRRKLGSIVFNDKSKLELLNCIVWPEIRKLRNEIIEDIENEQGGSQQVIIFEGAILFEAGWDRDANEIWCCLTPTLEVIKRIQDRDGLPEQAALKRLNSQMTNKERVSRSHVVISTQWETEFTQKQVEKAWELLQQRLELSKETHVSNL